MISFRETSIGRIGIEEKEGCIVSVYFETDAVPHGLEMGKHEGGNNPFPRF